LAELSSSTQHKCVSCGDPVTPTSGSIESGWATVCKTCSEDLLRRESRK
jgi:DNA-directed RNA polymerase subunit RPC12/RpoP